MVHAHSRPPIFLSHNSPSISRLSAVDSPDRWRLHSRYYKTEITTSDQIARECAIASPLGRVRVWGQSWDLQWSTAQRTSRRGGTQPQAPVMDQSNSVAAVNGVPNSDLSRFDQPTAQPAAVVPTAHPQALHTADQASVGKEYVTIVCAFLPTLPDELSVSMGEVLQVLEEFDDGWALCINERGDLGVVPVLCFERIPPSPLKLIPADTNESVPFRNTKPDSPMYHSEASSHSSLLPAVTVRPTSYGTLAGVKPSPQLKTLGAHMQAGTLVFSFCLLLLEVVGLCIYIQLNIGVY